MCLGLAGRSFASSDYKAEGDEGQSETVKLVVTPEQTWGEDESLQPIAYTENKVTFKFSLANAPEGKTINDYLVQISLSDEEYPDIDGQDVMSDLVRGESYTFGPMHNSGEYRAYFTLMEVVEDDTVPVSRMESESGEYIATPEGTEARVFSVNAEIPTLTYEPYSPNAYLELNNSTVTFTFKVNGEPNDGYFISGSMWIWDYELEGWDPNGWYNYTYDSEIVFEDMANGYYSAGFWLYDKYYYLMEDNADYTYLHVYAEPEAVERAEAIKVSLYPNPTSGRFNVEVKEDAVVEIYAMNGQLVTREKVAAGSNAFELNNAGVYMVRVAAAGKATTKRIVVR